MENLTHRVAFAYYEALDCARSLTCAIMLRYNEYDQLANLQVDPQHFSNADAYRRAAHATDFLRKYEALPTAIDKKAVAMETWWKAERDCYRTNRMISDATEGNNPSTQLLAFFARLREIMHSLIGRVPNELNYRFGPGVTFERRGSDSLILHKLSNVPAMTADCWIFLNDCRHSAWFRNLAGTLFKDGPQSFDFPVVRGNRFTTVPKDSKTDRGIAIEPTFNVFCQLGIGSAIRSALRRSGLLLDTSQEVHKSLARIASVTNHLSTIDLSSASDTMAYQLVQQVLPRQWLELTNASRSPMTQLPSGNWVLLEKYSSMGNGFTFELETAVFTTLCMYVAEQKGITLKAGHNFSVYGDDIIVPTDIADDVVKILKLVGFTPNPRKTFISGSFRESCGGDFFLGEDVRPIQWKREITSVPELFSLHNMLARSPFGAKASRLVKSLIPLPFKRFGGPTRLGDICLHGVTPWDRWRNGIREIKTIQTIVDTLPLSRWDSETVFAGMLTGLQSCPIPTRVGPIGHRSAWVTDS